MAEIKTREVVTGTIKTIDKASVGAERLKNSYAKTRSVVEANSVQEETSPSEYASTRIEQGLADGTSHTYRGINDMKGISISNRREKSKSATKNREFFQKNFLKINRSGSHSVESGKRIVAKGIKQSENVTKQYVNVTNRFQARQRKRYAIRQLTNSRIASRKNVRKLRRIGIAVSHLVRNIIAGTKALIAAIAAGGTTAIIVIVVCCLFGAALFLFGGGDSSSYTPVSPEVDAYSPTITKYAKEYGISEYTELIKAVMMHESGGKGTDPMDSSGFSYNTKYPEGITDPDYSIKCGVQKLADLISKNKCESALDMAGIRKVLEGYNTGDDDEAYVNDVLKYYPYGNFSDEVLLLGTGELGLPINGMTAADITSSFGGRESPGGIGSTNHKGLDLGFPIGTKVYACEKGTVIHAGWSGGFGKLVIVDHGNGMQTYYAHLSKINTAKGMKVVRGQNIGEVGNTGNSTGPHLHLGVMVNGSFMNPEKFLAIP